MKIVIAGGTGFIGTELTKKLLEGGHTVVLLTRDINRSRIKMPNMYGGTFSVQLWDGKTLSDWSKAIDGADAVINLSGESIAGKRWTPSQKAILLDSRLSPTRVIVEAISKAAVKPSLLINASAVGYYGDVESGVVREDMHSGMGFLADLCKQWEEAARKVEVQGVRIVLLRTSVALGKNGEALKKMLLPFKLFVGGPIGSGKQWMPWIHLEDEIRIILYALEHRDISGPINVTAPNPVTMKELASAIGKTIHRPSWAPVPGFVLKIALGEMAGMLLTGQKAIPSKLEKSGFKFKYPDLNEALSAILQE